MTDPSPSWVDEHQNRPGFESEPAPRTPPGSFEVYPHQSVEPYVDPDAPDPTPRVRGFTIDDRRQPGTSRLIAFAALFGFSIVAMGNGAPAWMLFVVIPVCIAILFGRPEPRKRQRLRRRHRH